MSQINDAMIHLRQLLSKGPLTVREIDARSAEHSSMTIRRAKKALGVVSSKTGFGASQIWFWSLPNRISDADLHHASLIWECYL